MYLVGFSFVLIFFGFMIAHALLLQPPFFHVHNILLLVAQTLFLDLYLLFDLIAFISIL